ncbi:MAG: hypothetical protein JSV61_15845 [Anaerolineales bacterium]|nr:MAG: hypothetical protein JSV61_15845 [Anaerolineales bacterium]
MKTDKLRIVIIVICPGLAAISIISYLITSRLIYRIGFPLDDAWIHQTYARNLGLYGDWAYIPGEPSAGSTSPLWSGVLAVGHFLGLGPYIWTYLLGWIFLAVLVGFGITIVGKFNISDTNLAVVTGIVLTFEWHLVWAAASGMETILFSCFILIILNALLRPNKSWFIIGALIGLCIYIRPDGLTLLGPVLFVLIAQKNKLRKKLSSGLNFFVGVLLLFVPYLVANLLLSGSYWPNTYYAKHAEYSIELSDPLGWRLLEQFSLPLVGVGILLLPGFTYFLYHTIKNRSWEKLSLALWAIGFLVVYAVRLPVTYQHGRYVIPMMPVYFICALLGTFIWLKPNAASITKRVLSKTLVVSGALILFAFWMLGARSYGNDVAIIESEMVNTANWIASDTEKDAIIAAHDIGALGYFGQRSLIDLAGLVSPDVIPFVRDEVRLAKYLDEQGVRYLVTFPGWYPLLINDLRIVYQSKAPFAPQQGGENMRIYYWNEIAKP